MGIHIDWPVSLQLLDAVQINKALTVFPLIGGGGSGDYLTLDEAQEKNLVFVAEQQQGASVPDIEIELRGKHSLLLLEGELLEGALQNRVVDMTLLLPPGKHRVPVNCVEVGRWGAKGRTRKWYANKSRRRRQAREFEATGTTIDNAIRRRKLRSTVSNMRTTGRVRADQGTTWAAIDDKLADACIASPGSDLLGLYESRWDEMVDVVETAEPVAEQVGAVVAIGGRVVAMEMVDSPTTWRRVWRKVLSGYVSESLDARRRARRPIEAEQAAGFVKTAATGQWQRTPSPVGEGSHATLETPVTGFCFSAQGGIRHAVLFAA